MSEKVYFLVAGSESTFPVDVSDIQRKFVARLQTYFPQNPVQWVGLKEVREGLFHGVQEAKELYPDAAVVTLSSLYFPAAEFQIGANRLIDESRKPLGLGPRPKRKNLAEQVADIVDRIGSRPVVAVDDTLFHGDTLSTLISLGLPVIAAVEYFSSLHAMQKFEARGVKVFTAVGLDDYLDVMPLHDFLPPLPLCGKVLGESAAEGSAPFYLNGVSFSFPYLMPWISAPEVESWSSVPEDKALNFSDFAIRQSIEVMERLWGQGFSTMEYASLHQPLRTSVPYMRNQNSDMNVSIPVMLKRYLHMLASEAV
jgi:hypothetical protein